MVSFSDNIKILHLYLTSNYYLGRLTKKLNLKILYMSKFTLEDNYLEHLLVQYGIKYKNVYQIQIQFFKKTFYFFNYINIKNIITKLKNEKFIHKETFLLKIDVMIQFITDLLNCNLEQMIDVDEIVHLSYKNDDYIHYIDIIIKSYAKTYRNLFRSCLSELIRFKNSV